MVPYRGGADSDRRAAERRAGRRAGGRRTSDAQRDAARDAAREAARDPAGAGVRRAGVSMFAAHLLGQDARRRGLKGGPETLEQARSAYLEAEWSGDTDRRVPTGKIARARI